jgi:hypothetical protein
MFSDKFIEINNYSLFNKEYLDTSSIMPWRYTSVFDSAYQPEMAEEIKNKFQLFFYYRLQYTAQILPDDKKYLEITHKDNVIKKYRAINSIKLPFFLDPGEWNHFIHSLEIVNLENCKQKIFDYVGEAVVTSGITSITYDENCNATGLYFQHDPNVRLNHSEIVNKLCGASLSNIKNTTTIHINPENNNISYNILPKYASRFFKSIKVTEKSKYDSSNLIPTKIKTQPQTDRVIQTLCEHDLLTNEMVDYIDQTIPKETKLEFEYIINEHGEMVDIILKNIIIEEFRDISAEQDHPMYDIFEKRNLI